MENLLSHYKKNWLMVIRLIVAKVKDSQLIVICVYLSVYFAKKTKNDASDIIFTHWYWNAFKKRLCLKKLLIGFHHDMNPLKASDFKFILLKMGTNNSSWILSLHIPQIGSEFIFKIMKFTATMNFGVSLDHYLRFITKKLIQIRSLLNFGMKTYFH